MCHEWIVEVLEDLVAYALRNGLAETAAVATDALRIARAEVGQGTSIEEGRGDSPTRVN